MAELHGQDGVLEATGESFLTTLAARSAGSATSATKTAPPTKRKAGSSPRTSGPVHGCYSVLMELHEAMTLLDPTFRKIVALIRSTQHAGEQKAARSRCPRRRAFWIRFQESGSRVKLSSAAAPRMIVGPHHPHKAA